MKRFISTFMAFTLISTSTFGQTLNDTFESSAQLTDQQVLDSQNYFHTGKAAREMKEACSSALKAEGIESSIGCNDESGKPGQVLGGNMGILEEMLPKLYATMGMMGGKIDMKPKAGSPEGTKGEEKDDVCIKIPMVGEIVATATQMMGQNQIQQSVEANGKTGADQQKESLYAVARTHDQRAKTANIQGGVYAATTACYAYTIYQGAVVKPTLILKLAAAGTMSTIFFMKAKKHKDYASAVRNAAKKLPGAGDCNPFTATQCFCSEPTSQSSDLSNYNKVCVPKELARNDKNKTGIACATLEAGAKTAKADPTCKCKKTNSCFNHQIAQLGASSGFGGIENSDPLRMLNMLSGDLDSANVEKFGNQLNAASRKVAAANVGEFPPANLKGRNKDIANGLKKLGMPAGMAGVVANQSGASAPAAASAGSLKDIGDDEYSDSGSAKPKKASYNYGGSIGSNNRKNNNSDVRNAPGKTGEAAINVDSFASEALAAAEINKDTSVGIFDVISNRYQRSAWTRFEMDKLVEEKSPDVIDPTVAPAPAQ